MAKPKLDITQAQQWVEVTQQNREDISSIKGDIHTIMTNHLKHLEDDMANVKNDVTHIKENMDRQDKKSDKMDNRVWAVLIILVVSTVIGMIKTGGLS